MVGLLDLCQPLSGTLDLRQDVFALCGPFVGPRILVVCRQVAHDLAPQRGDAGEAAIADDGGQVGEEAFDQVEPRSRRRREVHFESRVTSEPCPDPAVLVRGVVVGNDVDRQPVWRLPVDLLEEAQPLDMRVFCLETLDQLAVEIVHRREQRDGAVSDIVVGLGADVAGAERQSRLRAFQRLDLRLLVAAQHDGPLRWIEIQPHDIPELGLELRIVRQLERAL